MEKIKRIRLFEIILYAIILITVMTFPFFTGTFERRGWSGVFLEWLRLSPFLVVFLVNNYILVPQLLFKDKSGYYLLSCIILVAVTVTCTDLLFDLTRMVAPPFGEMPPENFPGKPGFPGPHNHPGPPHGLFGTFHFNLGQTIVSFLLIGFNTGVKIFIRYTENQMRQTEKERQHLYTELAFLKYQISPHFFMNTLNNIHALVDINSERAKDAIVKLSRMMRYLLYESEPDKVSLKKEIDFIESYIELMRLRYNETNLDVSFIYPQETENIRVPAFLFLSFIENAFKYGIHSTQKSFIRLAFSAEPDNRLAFTMENSLGDQRESLKESSGIGIENIKKRLNILYKDDYTLNIQEMPSTFRVTLNIPKK